MMIHGWTGIVTKPHGLFSFFSWNNDLDNGGILWRCNMAGKSWERRLKLLEKSSILKSVFPLPRLIIWCYDGVACLTNSMIFGCFWTWRQPHLTGRFDKEIMFNQWICGYTSFRHAYGMESDKKLWWFITSHLLVGHVWCSTQFSKKIS